MGFLIRLNKKEKKKKPSKKALYATYTKSKVSLILGNAIVWVYLSYILAFLGKEDIAEQLSITVVKVIIYTFIPYLCKAFFENICKYQWNGGDSNLKNPYLDDKTESEDSTNSNTEVTIKSECESDSDSVAG